MKFHTSIDIAIEHNLIRNSKREAIWLDNTEPGVRVVHNVLVNNPDRGLFVEMGYGPVLVDNNVLINTQVALHDSGGSFFVHNLFVDCPNPDISKVVIRKPTLYEPHTMKAIGSAETHVSDNKFYNNLFIHKGLTIPAEVPNVVFGNEANWNAYVGGATGSPGSSGKSYDADSMVSDFAADFRYSTDETGLHVNFRMDATPFQVAAPYITPGFLGPIALTKALIPEAVSADFFGHPIDAASPIPGPFAELKQGDNSFTLWTGALTD